MLTFPEKAAYPLGEIATQFVWTVTSSYLLSYYTDVALIAPASAAIIFLVARVLDGLQDPVVGYVAERTHTRWGRFRPYVVLFAPLTAILLVAAFWSPSAGSTAKILWAAVTYVLLGFCYSTVNICYGAMSGVMTTDGDERLTLTWLRNIGNNAAQILLSIVVMPMILVFSAGDAPDGHGYLVTIATFAVLSVPLFWLCAAPARERVQPTRAQSNVPLRTTLKAVVTNRPLVIIFVMLLCCLMGIFGRIGMVVYYVRYDVGNIGLVSVVMLTMTIAGLVGGVVFPKMAGRFGKKRMVLASLFGGAAALLVLFFGPMTSVPFVIVMTALYGLTMFGQPLFLAMVPDAVDHYRWKHGVRTDGTAWAITSLAAKLASALGGSLGMVIIAWFGYVANAEPTPSVMTGINVATNLVPALFLLLGAAVTLLYPLDEELMARVQADLRARGDVD